MRRLLIRVRSETIVVNIHICLVPAMLPAAQQDFSHVWHCAASCVSGIKDAEGCMCLALQCDGILSPIYVS